MIEEATLSAAYHDRYLATIETLAGVGPKTAARLERKNLRTIADLLYSLPLRYEDRRCLTSIAAVVPGGRYSVAGCLETVRQAGGRGRLRRTTARLTDSTGSLDVVWFGFTGQSYRTGQQVVLCGEVGVYRDRPQMSNPDGQVFDGETPPCAIVPVYSETEGLRQRSWRKLLDHALAEAAAGWRGGLPDDLRRRYDLPDVETALRHLHRPPTETTDPLESLLTGEGRDLRALLFEELFIFQLGLAVRRRLRRKSSGFAFAADEARMRPFLEALPFSLTAEQRACWEEIRADLQRPEPMRRLLHGDVGSGKTVLAALAVHAVVSNGCQAAIMAPTEVLAEQHAAWFEAVFRPLNIRTALVTGSLPSPERRRLNDRVALGLAQVVIGTHALLSGDVAFKQLGLVVIDEQHKFGVSQRASLIVKGHEPDVLVLTATPIPRSLALTLYGHLDVSRLAEKPAGRGRIVTRLVERREREIAYDEMRKFLLAGRRGYVICPRLEQSDDNVGDVESLFQELRRGLLSDFRLGLLHGKMTAAARREIMSALAGGALDAVVATSVVEVGVDVPAAGVMIVENAERFGLAQLHQFRGRIGRDGGDALCILVHSEDCRAVAYQRLAFLTKCDDGFEIAEQDLLWRGPGELLGTRQSGLPPLRFARLMPGNLRMVEDARVEAERLLAADPLLAAPANYWTKMVVNQRWGALLGGGGEE